MTNEDVFAARKELAQAQQRRLGLRWFRFEHRQPTMRAAFALVRARQQKAAP